MASGIQCLEVYDGVVARLEATSTLAELENEFLLSMKAFPFEGAAFAWGGNPPPVREPDFRMESGSVSIDEATPTQPGVELWSKSLPVTVGAASRGAGRAVGPTSSLRRLDRQARRGNS